jgi:uncharacterized protein YbbK (DUF523 family)
MPDTPAPLREALRGAVEQYVAITASVEGHEYRYDGESLVEKHNAQRELKVRVDALLSQIPPDLEANDAE